MFVELVKNGLNLWWIAAKKSEPNV